MGKRKLCLTALSSFFSDALRSLLDKRSKLRWFLKLCPQKFYFLMASKQMTQDRPFYLVPSSGSPPLPQKHFLSPSKKSSWRKLVLLRCVEMRANRSPREQERYPPMYGSRRKHAAGEGTEMGISTKAAEGLHTHSLVDLKVSGITFARLRDWVLPFWYLFLAILLWFH